MCERERDRQREREKERGREEGRGKEGEKEREGGRERKKDLVCVSLIRFSMFPDSSHIYSKSGNFHCQSFCAHHMKIKHMKYFRQGIFQLIATA